MKLANRAFLVTLVLLSLLFAVSAQTKRPENDPRNTAPTVGTGGNVGGPTGLFTVYDGQTLRKGEYTFSLAYSNYDRDPGDVDITEVPVSFQIGLNDHLELFFNTDAYRGVKVNSPGNLSGFYLPNSRLNGISPGAIVLAPRGTGTSQFAGRAVYRPAGTAAFVMYPFVGGNAGTFGFQPPFSAGSVFGFTTPVATLGGPLSTGNGASTYAGLGSTFGGILPGIVFQTATANGNTVPTVFTLAPSYLADAPLLNRTYGESAFSTMSTGLKWRWTAPNDSYGLGLVGYYSWFTDSADDAAGFNQLQRGASPGGSKGDIGVSLFADVRVRKWMNIAGNVGYKATSAIEGNGGTLLDRGDEIIGAFGVDFPVNRYFQPILEVTATRYVGGRTPNAFENNPVDGLVGFRVFPARWLGFSAGFRYNFNQQDRDSFDGEDETIASAVIPCLPGMTAPCTPQIVNTRIAGVPPGFRASSDPYGFIFQSFIGRRNDREGETINNPPSVNSVDLSKQTLTTTDGCPAGTRAACDTDNVVNVSTKASDPENDVLTYNYTVSGGKVTGSGANVSWDLTGVKPGTYTITAGVDDGCGVCGKTQTKTIEVKTCDKCEDKCECPSSIGVTAGSIAKAGDNVTFTANVNGGSQSASTYNWSVSCGDVVEGQGSSALTVKTPADGSCSNVTATVEVGGLCANCTNTASETAIVPPVPRAFMTDEFQKAQNDEIKAFLDNLYIRLNADPTATGLIVNYGTKAEITKRKAAINKALQFLQYDASRLQWADGPSDGMGIRTKFWVIPAGADAPQV